MTHKPPPGITKLRLLENRQRAINRLNECLVEMAELETQFKTINEGNHEPYARSLRKILNKKYLCSGEIQGLKLAIGADF